MYIMEHPDLVLSNFMKNSIGFKRVKRKPYTNFRILRKWNKAHREYDLEKLFCSNLVMKFEFRFVKNILQVSWADPEFRPVGRAQVQSSDSPVPMMA